MWLKDKQLKQRPTRSAGTGLRAGRPQGRCRVRLPEASSLEKTRVEERISQHLQHGRMAEDKELRVYIMLLCMSEFSLVDIGVHIVKIDCLISVISG